MATLHLLGTGAGLLNPQRNASSYLLETETGDVLMDAGEPVSATLAKRGYEWSRLAGIILTHTHADHIGGLPMLMQQLHLSGRTHPLEVHGPPEFVERLREYFGIHYLIVEAMKFELQSYGLAAGHTFKIAGVEFAPSTTRHLEPARKKVGQYGYPNRCQAFSLRFASGSESYFYSGDVNAFEDVREHIGPARLALLDSTHVNTDQIVKWAAQHPDCQVILSHLVPGFDALGVLAKASAARAGNLRVACDGEVIDL
jgi:ribonuclease BN (tRNA processing enzyme)